MNALVLLAVLQTTLVLHSGDRIAVEGKPVEKDGVLTFRSQGMLFSLPASEVSRIDEAQPPSESKIVVTAPRTQTGKRRPVSDEEKKRLLAELEKNHGGTAPAPPPELPPAPTREEAREIRREETSWRREARYHEETVRRAKEDLELLESKAIELQDKIRSLTAQGYKPSQFTYDTTQLQYTLDRLPQARLDITRAERAFDQFREDARREGVMPGWLR